MQKCKSCGASWDIEHIIDVCPFCGADLREKTKASSIEDAFKIILKRHGKVAFQSKILLGLLGDYAPTVVKEKKLVKVAVEAGAYKAICEASIAERENVLNKYVLILSNSFFIDEIWARRALMWCVNALSENTESSKLKNYSIDPGLIIKDGILKKYSGSTSILKLPSTVHTIAPNAFRFNDTLTEVVIPDSIRVIGKSAFAYCSNLERITFIRGLKEIGEWAFVNCKKLKYCILPDSVTRVDQYAFQGCTALATVQLSNRITEIQEGTFFDCKSLVSIKFPQQLKIIRKMAFKDCETIENLILPELLEMIETEAFSCCWHLKKITVTSNIKIAPEVFSGFYKSNNLEIKYLKKILATSDGSTHN